MLNQQPTQQQIIAELKARGIDSQGQTLAPSGAPGPTRTQIIAELKSRGMDPQGQPIKGPTFLQKAEAAPGEIEQQILDIGGGAVHGAQEAAKGLWNLGVHGAFMLDPVLRQVAQKAQFDPAIEEHQLLRAPFADPQSLAYKAASIGTQIAPLFIGEEGGILGPLKRGGEFISKIPKRAINALTGKNVTNAISEVGDAAKGILSDYYKDPNYVETKLGSEQQQVGKLLRKKYREQKKVGKNLYDSALDKVGQRSVVPKGVTLKEFKFLTPLEKETSGAIGKQLTNRINTFKDNPTIENLHWLQSQTGQRINNLRALDYGKTDPNAIENLESVKKGMVNHLNKIAGPSYKEASRHWASKVVPFTKDAIVNKAVTKNIFSPSLAKRISTLEHGIDEPAADGNAINKIVKQFTPKEKDTFLLPAASKGATDSTGVVSPNTVLNNLSKMRGAGYGNIMNQNEIDELSQINSLKKGLEKVEKANKTKNRARIAAGAVSSLAGLNYLGKYFPELSIGAL